MRPANNQQLFNDDGTPRRKYEIDESPSNKYLLRASIGFVLANAFILAKNIMFGAEPASKQQQISLSAAANEPSEHADEPNAAGLDEEETYGDGPASSQLDSGTIRLLPNPGTADLALLQTGVPAAVDAMRKFMVSRQQEFATAMNQRLQQLRPSARSCPAPRGCPPVRRRNGTRVQARIRGRTHTPALRQPSPSGSGLFARRGGRERRARRCAGRDEGTDEHS